jgi:hypothetical protein
MTKSELENVLPSMANSHMDRIVLDKHAICLEFYHARGHKSVRYLLKTTSFVTRSTPETDDYESEMRKSVPLLYRELEETLTNITFDGETAKLEFSSGATFIIRDVEELWDNTFSVEVIKHGQSEEFLFGGSKSAIARRVD